MRRIICALLALSALFLCAGCAASEPEPPSGIYYDITGIAPDETLMEVDGNAVPAELYFYWTMYNCDAISYQILSANSYYGAYEELLNEDSTLNWGAELLEGTTVSQYAREQAENAVKLYATVENMAETYGVAMTEEDQAALEADRASVVEELGGEEVFQEELAKMGLSAENFDRLSSAAYLLEGLTNLVLEEGSPLYLSPEGYDQYATYADHILLATVDLTTGAALSQEGIDAKRATAEDLLSQLRSSDDPEALFAQLADQYSEDTGRASNPTGYIYTPGTMVQVFEDTAAALRPGEISDVIESSYGYHILLRRDLAQGLEEYPEQKRALAEEHLNSLLQLAIQEAQITTSDKLNDLDAGAFYESYAAIRQEQEAAQAGEDGTGDAGADASGEDTGEDAGGNSVSEDTGESGQ